MAAGAAGAGGPDLAELWQQILAGLELPSTRMLLSQQAQLVRLDEHRAVIRVAGTWMAMVQSRVSLLEGAVARALGSPRQLLLEGASEARANTAAATAPMPTRPATVAVSMGTTAPLAATPVNGDPHGIGAAASPGPGTDPGSAASGSPAAASPAPASAAPSPGAAPPGSLPTAAAANPEAPAPTAAAGTPAATGPQHPSPGPEAPLVANSTSLSPSGPDPSQPSATTSAAAAASATPAAQAPGPVPGFPSPIDEKAKRLADFFNGEVVELNDSAGSDQNEAA